MALKNIMKDGTIANSMVAKAVPAEIMTSIHKMAETNRKGEKNGKQAHG